MIKRPEFDLPKRSECKCLCHTDANSLGLIPAVMHVMPCCYPDDNLNVVLQPCGRLHSLLEGCSHCEAIKRNIMKGEANCSHGIAMDIYCEECEKDDINVGKEQIFKMLEGRIDTASGLLTECFELMYKAGFNAAIEAAAKLCEHDGYTVGEIRKLKK